MAAARAAARRRPSGGAQVAIRPGPHAGLRRALMHVSPALMHPAALARQRAGRKQRRNSTPAIFFSGTPFMPNIGEGDEEARSPASSPKQRPVPGAFPCSAGSSAALPTAFPAPAAPDAPGKG